MDHFNTHYVPLFYRILVRYQRLMTLNVTMIYGNPGSETSRMGCVRLM